MEWAGLAKSQIVKWREGTSVKQAYLTHFTWIRLHCVNTQSWESRHFGFFCNFWVIEKHICCKNSRRNGVCVRRGGRERKKSGRLHRWFKIHAMQSSITIWLKWEWYKNTEYVMRINLALHVCHSNAAFVLLEKAPNIYVPNRTPYVNVFYTWTGKALTQGPHPPACFRCFPADSHIQGGNIIILINWSGVWNIYLCCILPQRLNNKVEKDEVQGVLLALS